MPQSSGYKLSYVNECFEFTEHWQLWIRKVIFPCMETDNNDMSLTAPQLKLLLDVFGRLSEMSRGTYLISGNLVLSKTTFGVTAYNLISGDSYCFATGTVEKLKAWVSYILIKELKFKEAYESEDEGLVPFRIRWM